MAVHAAEESQPAPRKRRRRGARTLRDDRRAKAKDRRITQRVILVVAVLLLGTVVRFEAAGPLLFVCFMVYAWGLRAAVRDGLDEYVPFWKCACLALILMAMQAAVTVALLQGRIHSFPPLIVGGCGCWFIFSMLFRSFFRVRAVWMTLLGASLAALFTMLGVFLFRGLIVAVI